MGLGVSDQLLDSSPLAKDLEPGRTPASDRKRTAGDGELRRKRALYAATPDVRVAGYVGSVTLSKLYVDLLRSGGRGGESLAVATVRHVHRSLRKALNDAVLIDGDLASNPALLAKLPMETRRVTPSMWTAEDLDAFLECISGHRLHAFYRVAAFTGARRGEMLHLR